MNSLRVAAMRRLYRVAWLGLQLYSTVVPRRGRGVKCVLTHGGRVLLVRHTYGQRHTWYVPGGGVRRREPPLEAAAREMREELGVRDLRWRELVTRDMRVDRMEVRLTCVYAELSDPAAIHPDPIEIAQARWFELDALPAPLGGEVRLLVALLVARLED
jgi:ADP-ribose pyrophosphatase YjhB (NUDIX family)